MPRTIAEEPAPRATYVELTCLFCGHSVPEVRVRGGRRPTPADLRAAYAAARIAAGPEWDAHGEPRCPRCGAKLFIEVTRRLRIFSDDRLVARRPAGGAERREDEYEREDVYVPAEAVTD